MLPEAWNIEHNRLHHYHLGEPMDPDLVERNLAFLRKMDIPLIGKYAVVAVFMPIWKWMYYAPNVSHIYIAWNNHYSFMIGSVYTFSYFLFYSTKPYTLTILVLAIRHLKN